MFKRRGTHRILFTIAASLLFGCGDSDQAPIDTLEPIEQGLLKGQSGAQNGDGNYCKGALTCDVGEGDCDRDDQCSAGLICAHNVGARFGFVAGLDLCLPAHCTNRKVDLASGETGLDCGGVCGACPDTNPYPIGHPLRCADPNFPCDTGEGPCYNNAACDAGLTCGINRGGRYGLATNLNVCVPAHCMNNKQDAGLGETGLDCGGECGACPNTNPYPIGHPLHCADPNFPCDIGEGPCYNDDACDAGLACGINRGERYGLATNLNVCVPAHCVNGLQDLAEGELGQDCGGDCGTCPAPNNRPIVSDVRIEPAPNQQLNVTLSCPYTFSDADNDPDLSTIEWLIDGRPASQQATFSAYTQGEQVTCRVTPADGKSTGVVVTSSPVSRAHDTISAGAYYSCAIVNADLKCWGSNEFGQLGTSVNAGTKTPNPTPQTVLFGGVTQLSAVSTHTCAIQAGALKCWGSNEFGQLGTSANVGSFLAAPHTVFADGVTHLRSGTSHTCAVQAGALKCWGSNEFGQLGVAQNEGTTTPNPIPQTIFSSGVTQLYAGGVNTCARHNGVLKCWGSNNFGELISPAPTSSYSSTPKAIIEAQYSELSLGATANCINNHNGLQCWGSNAFGQLGTSVNLGLQDVTTPPQTIFGADISYLSLGFGHTCAIHQGALKCWGWNYQGQLGAQPNPMLFHPNPDPVTVIPSGATEISAGLLHTCAKANGVVKCWGGNMYGELGIAQNIGPIIIPTDVPGL